MENNLNSIVDTRLDIDIYLMGDMKIEFMFLEE